MTIHRALIVLLVTWKSLGCRVALTDMWVMGNTLTNQSGLWWVPWFPYNGDQWWPRNPPSVPTESLYQCLALLHNLPLLLPLWAPLFGGSPLITVIGLLGLVTTSASHTHHWRMYTSVLTSMSIELWDLYRSNLLWIVRIPMKRSLPT